MRQSSGLCIIAFAIFASATSNSIAQSPGQVLGHQKISDTEGGFDGALNDGDFFGGAMATVGDLDGDGVEDLVVGAERDDDGGNGRGAVWILYLNTDGTVKSHSKISAAPGEYMDGLLANGDHFGSAIATLGDLDGDGLNDLAVGAVSDDDGASMPPDPDANLGAVYILFLNDDESVRAHHKISAAAGGDMAGLLDDGDTFGRGMVAVGDLDDDGVVDLAVGAHNDSDGGVGRGAVWILFLNPDGSVKAEQKINDVEGGFTGELDDVDEFGLTVAAPGDVDDDGIEDLAVTAIFDDDGGTDRGAVWILYLNANGTVKSHTKISDTEGGFSGVLDDSDGFGYSVVPMGDLDGDGIGDLAVSAERDDDGGTDRGAVWILFLNEDETVKSHQKISDLEGGFDGTLDDGDRLGAYSMAAVGDLNGDGINDLASAAHGDDDGGTNRGAVWILFLDGVPPPPGYVLGHQKISDTQGGFDGAFNDQNQFGSAVAAGDLDADGVEDLLVGARLDSDGAVSAGAVWVLYLNPGGSVKSFREINAAPGGDMEGLLSADDKFGYSIASLGDLNGDGFGDWAVGAHSDDDGGLDRGSVWILFLDENEVVQSHHKISAEPGGEMAGLLDDLDGFGGELVSLGDLDGDGLSDLAVGAPFDDDGASEAGAVWILELNSNGTVNGAPRKISFEAGGFDAIPNGREYFGRGLAAPGDLDGDQIPDLFVGASLDDDGGFERGAVWILYLNTDGTVKSHAKISDTAGGFEGVLDDSDYFGYELAATGDLDGDGIGDLAVHAIFDDDGGIPPDANLGAVWILFLNDDETVKSHLKISATEGGFTGDLDPNDRLGSSMAMMGDLNGDGFRDLACGTLDDGDGGINHGAVWLLYLSGFTSIDFDDPQEYAAAGEPIINDTGDLDGDGDEDVVVVIPDDDPGLPGEVQVFLNNGNDMDGAWLGFTANDPIPVGLDPSGVTLGFFDGDAFLDMAVTNAGNDNVFVFLNDGLGTGEFNAPTSFAVGDEPRAITTGRLNGPDLMQDLAVANASDGEVVILNGDGSGSFAMGEVIMAPGGPCAMEPEDLDDDKDTDLLIARCNASGLLVWFQGAAPGPGTVSIDVATNPVDVAVGDIDGNGLIDLASANVGGTVAVILNQGAGMFDPAVEVAVGADPRSVDAADLDGDGDPDLAVVADDAAIGPAVQVLTNESGGEGVAFGATLAFEVNADPNFVAAADLNGDGLSDLVTANSDDGPSGGSVTGLISNPPSPAPECPGDFGGDGEVGFADLLDLLAAWSADPGSCVGCPADLDGDGDVDFQDLLLVLSAWGGCP